MEIQDCLYHGISFKNIAKRIGKDPTTVSKEVKKHITCSKSLTSQTHADSVCPLLLRPPYVCNPCKRLRVACPYVKQMYYAKQAQEQYEETLSDARSGIPLTKAEFYEVDKVISTGVGKGQHVYHILKTHNLPVSSATVYRHINKGYLSVQRMDLPRAVKFKARTKKNADYIPTSAKKGRTYTDFTAYKDMNDVRSWVELDTVIGRIGGKVILTLDFTFCNFMVALLLDNKSAMEVSEKIRGLKERLAANDISFSEIFPVLLTDNGGEFSNIAAIENDASGNKGSLLFFCDPGCPNQKPRVEKNHTLFRDICPKGTSFDDFTQEMVNKIFSHINGVKRKNLHGKSPYEMFCFAHSKQLAGLLGISEVPAEEVIQTTKLIRK
jgi:IS30 family transposase